MVADVKADIDREMRESELADLRKLGDEITDVKDEIEKTGSDAADDSSLMSVADSIRESAEEIRSTVKDAAEVAEAQAQDSTQDNAEESPTGTDSSMAPEKQAAT
jgi:transposase